MTEFPYMFFCPDTIGRVLMEQLMYLAIMEFIHVRRALGLHCSTATDPRPLSSVSPAFRECSNIRGTDPRDLYHLCHTVPSEIFSPQRRPRSIVDRSTVDGTKVSFDHDDELELFDNAAMLAEDYTSCSLDAVKNGTCGDSNCRNGVFSVSGQDKRQEGSDVSIWELSPCR